MGKEHRQMGMRYVGHALKFGLGAGLALGGGYILSRIGDKQDTESSLSRLEQMLAELAESEEQAKAAAPKKRK